MKFQVTFKTPDALHYALEDQAPIHQREMKELASKFIEYGEYLRVEFDSETGTATVVPIA